MSRAPATTPGVSGPCPHVLSVMAWLTDVIREVHTASYGSYGAKRVYAELVLGRGIRVVTMRSRC